MAYVLLCFTSTYFVKVSPPTQPQPRSTSTLGHGDERVVRAEHNCDYLRLTVENGWIKDSLLQVGYVGEKLGDDFSVPIKSCFTSCDGGGETKLFPLWRTTFSRRCFVLADRERAG